MKKRIVIFFFFAVVIIVGILLASSAFSSRDSGQTFHPTPDTQSITTQSQTAASHPLSIHTLRQGSYPGSQIRIEETLTPGSNYQRYIASYQSEGLQINSLLTIPNGQKPATGWPVIIFNHGYIPPKEYRTTERYIAYTDAFSRNGYIVLRSDYRGHNKSEGEAPGAYSSNAYTIDVLNAVASIKQHPDADPNRIGMWGHSMGGYITLRSMVANKDIKAGVIWAGVVSSPIDIIRNWQQKRAEALPSYLSEQAQRWQETFLQQYGDPDQNPEFWKAISSNSHLSDISGPVQLHHGTADDSVPLEYSEKLEQELQAVNKPVELFTYPGDDHNIAKNFRTAINRSVEFFDTHVKGEQ